MIGNVQVEFSDPVAVTSCPSRGARALIAEARRRQRRRSRRQALVAVVAMLAAGTAAASVAGWSARSGHPVRSGSYAPPGAAGPMPAQVVVWTGSFKIEVLASRTGRTLRTLASNVALYRGLPTVAVSATGTVYFDDARRHQDWVMSVPLAGGPITAIAPGRGPAVSPDGRSLAYVTYTDLSGAPEAIVVRNLASGTQRSWAFRSARPDIDTLSWSADGRFLSFTVNRGPFLAAAARILDVRSTAGLDSARPIRLAAGLQWAGFLTPTIGLALAPSRGQQPEGLVEVAVRNGRVLRRLTSLRYPLFTSNSLTGTESAITADPGGHFVLIATSGPHGHGEIFRLTVGKHRLVPIARAAARACWAAADHGAS